VWAPNDVGYTIDCELNVSESFQNDELFIECVSVNVIPLSIPRDFFSATTSA